MKKAKLWIDPFHLNITQKLLICLGVFGLIFVVFIIMLPHGSTNINNAPSPTPIVNFNSPANVNLNKSVASSNPLAELSQYNHDFVNSLKINK